MKTPDSQVVAAMLVLRREVDSSLALARPPRRMAGAFSSVFSMRLQATDPQWRVPLILRFCDAPHDPEQARRERLIHNGIGQAGFPAPLVLHAHLGDGGGDPSFLVMERVEGRPQLRGTRWDRFARDFPRVLARWPARFALVADRLHRTDPTRLLHLVDQSGLERHDVSIGRHLARIEAGLDRPDFAWARAAVAWLRDHAPADPSKPVLVHGDLWPANVLTRRGNLSGVVDWNRAGIGEVEADIGFAAAGLALMPAPFPPPSPLARVINLAGRDLAARVVAAYAERGRIDVDRVRYYEALRCIVEVADAVLPAGLEAEPRHAARPWSASIPQLLDHFREVAGVEVVADPTVLPGRTSRVRFAPERLPDDADSRGRRVELPPE